MCFSSSCVVTPYRLHELDIFGEGFRLQRNIKSAKCTCLGDYKMRGLTMMRKKAAVAKDPVINT
uniref:Uncharacterized protein n=1 Tax=Oryza nivara TaxID=4536 RepID=A0A0E0IRR2_ORYNI